MAKTITKPRSKIKKSRAKTASKRVSANGIQNKVFNLNINALHKIIIGSNAVLASLVVGLMAPAVFPITLSYLTRDALLSEAGTVFVPADRVLWDVDLRLAMVGLLIFGALYSLLLLTRWAKSYEKALKDRVWFWRWVYLALSFAVMVAMVAVLTGIYDVFTIKLLGALTAAGFAFAWLSERQNVGGARRSISAYLLGWAGVILLWKIIGWHTLSTTLYGLERLPWHAYAAQAAVALGVILIFVSLWLGITRRKCFADYRAVERSYLIVTLLSQVALAAILLIGFQR